MLDLDAVVDALLARPDLLARLKARLEWDTDQAVLRNRACDMTPHMTPEEAAAYLRCSRKRIYDLCGDGRLTRLKVGRSLLLDRAEVERLIDSEGHGMGT